MATRSMRFFIRPGEFETAMHQIVVELDLWLVLDRYRDPNPRIEDSSQIGSITMSDGKVADVIYLMAEKPKLKSNSRRGLQPGKWGWAMCNVPHERDNVLFMSQLAAKSDWYEPASGRILDNPASLQLFKKIAPYFRKRLKRPVWYYHVVDRRPLIARDIGYTDGVIEWVRGGGELMQEGVANVRYSLEKPDHLPSD